MKYLLENLKDKKNRKARFKTVIALILEGKETLVEGIVEGEILCSPIGSGGFGYDPVFKPTESNKTFAEMSGEEKNKISHRGRATEKLLKLII